MAGTGKTLYLSYDGLTDPLGQSQVLPYIIGLNEKGYNYHIVSFEKPANTDKIQGIREELNRHKIQWTPLSYTSKPPVLSTLYDIYRLRKTVLRIIGDEPSKYILHCRSYITSLIGLSMKRKYGSKFIFDMRGFWADERIDGNIWSLGNPVFRLIYRYFKSKEKKFFTSSDYTISLTHAGKSEIYKLLHTETEEVSPIQVIPCCVDNDLFDYNKLTPNDVAQTREQLNIAADTFVLGYVGSIGTWYMLPEMVTFFKQLLKVRQNAVFLFISKENPSAIYGEFERQEIDTSHVRITGSARSEMPRHIAVFDWSIFFIKPVFSKQASSPTKQGEIMSMGKPIVCNSNVGDTEQIIKKYDAGIVTESFEASDFEKIAHQMLNYEISPGKIRQGSIEFYNLGAGIDSYNEVYTYIRAC